MDHSALLDHITAQRRTSHQPVVVGISGYGGSGKSTLARKLVEALPGSVRMRGDDFLDPARSHSRSTDWDGVDRLRLVSEVLAPLRSGRPSRFRRFDWSTRMLGVAEPLPQTDLLIVDLIGLFHPEALPNIDVTIWCDVDLETAAQRGIMRDRQLGRNHEDLWHKVWLPNERDFAERFSPREQSNVLYTTSVN